MSLVRKILLTLLKAILQQQQKRFVYFPLNMCIRAKGIVHRLNCVTVVRLNKDPRANTETGEMDKRNLLIYFR